MGGWLTDRLLRTMVRYLLIGFELQIYEPDEYFMIYWFVFILKINLFWLFIYLFIFIRYLNNLYLQMLENYKKAVQRGNEPGGAVKRRNKKAEKRKKKKNNKNNKIFNQLLFQWKLKLKIKQFVEHSM